MARNTQLIEQRNKKIKSDFQKFKKDRKFLTEYIIEEIAKKNFLTPRTVQAIVFEEKMYSKSK
jgi:hypothetical protein